MSRSGRSRRASMAWLLLGMTALAGTTALAACSRSETPGAKAEGRVPGVAVVVAQVTARDVPVRVRAIGNVQASATVSVLAQIGGEITKIHFKEGQDVADRRPPRSPSTRAPSRPRSSRRAPSSPAGAVT